MTTAKQMIHILEKHYTSGNNRTDEWTALNRLMVTELSDRIFEAAHAFANEIYWANEKNTKIISKHFKAVHRAKFRPIPVTRDLTCTDCNDVRSIKVTSWTMFHKPKEHYCDEHAVNWATKNAAWRRKHDPTYHGPDKNPVRYKRKTCALDQNTEHFLKKHDID